MRVALLERLPHRVLAAQQVARHEQQVHEVEPPRARLQLAVARDRRLQLALQQRGQIGIRRAAELAQAIHEGALLLQQIRSRDSGRVARSGAAPRIPEPPVERKLDQLRLDAVVVAPRPHRFAGADRLGRETRGTGVEVQAVAAIGCLLRPIGEAAQVPDDPVHQGLPLERRAPVGRVEVAPLGQLPGRGAEAIGRPVVGRIRIEAGRRGPAAQRAANAVGRIREHLLQPQVEGAGEQPARLRL